MGRLSVPGFPIPLTRGYSLLVQRFRCGPRLHALSAAPPRDPTRDYQLSSLPSWSLCPNLYPQQNLPKARCGFVLLKVGIPISAGQDSAVAGRIW